MIIESKQNPLVKQLKKCKEKSGRDKSGLFLAEGTRLTFHAVKSGVPLEYLLCTPDFLKENSQLFDGLDYQLVTESVLKELCDTQHPQGVVAAVRKTSADLQEITIGESCFYVFCDEVRDPGNMGTIIRTAEAAGVDGVIVPRGCVDIFSQKVVRSTMGSIFTLPIFVCDDKITGLQFLRDKGCEVLAADMGGQNLYQHTFAQKSVIIIGNEANGVSDEALSVCDEKISVPMADAVESLNAAVSFAVISYERLRQKLI